MSAAKYEMSFGTSGKSVYAGNLQDLLFGVVGILKLYHSEGYEFVDKTQG